MVSCIAFVLFSLSVVLAGTQAIDRLFTDLANIIEQNMDSPYRALNQVDQYYRDNQALVEQARHETAEALEQSQTISIMEEVASYQQRIMEAASRGDSDEIERLGRELEALASRASALSSSGITPPAAQRYSQVLEEFSRRYPEQGMQIGLRAQQLAPQGLVPFLGEPDRFPY